MNTLKYNVDLTNLDVMTTIDDILKYYLCDGHPHIYLPGFKEYKADIWAHFLDYFDVMYGEIWDQDGGEYDPKPKSIDADGKINIGYTFYGLQFDEDSDAIDELHLDIEGYVIRDENFPWLYPTRIEFDDSLMKK